MKEALILIVVIIVLTVVWIIIRFVSQKLTDQGNHHLRRALDNEFSGNKEHAEAHAQDFQNSNRKLTRVITIGAGAITVIVIIYLLISFITI